MMYYVKEHDSWVISSGGSWLPGSFETKGAGHLAFRLNDSSLSMLNKKINIEEKRNITIDDVRKALKNSTLTPSQQKGNNE